MAKVVSTENLNKLISSYDPLKNTSVDFITRFEAASALGVREEQIAQGAPSVLSNEELETLYSPQEIAAREMETRKMPFMFLRTLPCGKQEIWRMQDLRFIGQ
jgi:DNA-directed RNA polymerase subunit K/omega